jgi:RNA polymerase sigma-70 factor (ECF subfamily)
MPTRLSPNHPGARADPALPGAVVDDLGGDSAAAVGAYVDAARAVWPELGVDVGVLSRHVSARTSTGRPPPLAHAGDMLLACGCTWGLPAAIETFHRDYQGVIARVLSRRNSPNHVLEDAAQNVYERLLVSRPGREPGIADYRATGPLRAWVSSVTARTLAMMRRTRERLREEGSPDLLERLSTPVTPELLYVNERHRRDLQRAIATVLDRLADRERTLLRLSLAERMSIDELAVIYDVNRATAARWLAAAREALVRGTRDQVRDLLHVTDRDSDGTAGLIQSDFDLSIVQRLT